MDAQDREAIAEAVRQAELTTAAEIVVVIERAASGYRSVPLALALLLALLLPWPLLALTATSAPRIFLIQLVAAAVLIAALQWYGRGGRFVPGFIKRRRAHDAALREFTARGLARTQGRTGVLLYVALQERYAEILADSAIETRVEPGAWEGVIGALLDEARAGRVVEGVIAAVGAVGVVLARHAPRQEGDVDELPNKVVLL
ncbi:MAG: TPM domain-containing protein [Bosea sp. (in: a-proteobacteria)]